MGILSNKSTLLHSTPSSFSLFHHRSRTHQDWWYLGVQTLLSSATSPLVSIDSLSGLLLSSAWTRQPTRDILYYDHTQGLDVLLVTWKLLGCREWFWHSPPLHPSLPPEITAQLSHPEKLVPPQHNQKMVQTLDMVSPSYQGYWVIHRTKRSLASVSESRCPQNLYLVSCHHASFLNFYLFLFSTSFLILQF